MKGLHIISTGKQSTDEFIKKVKAIHAKIDFIHIRERNWTAKDHIAVIRKLIAVGVDPKKIIINDRVDIAVTGRVGGVQLTSHSLDVCDVKKYFPSLQIGCSVHSVEEALEKEEQGANYLIYGHIFKTNSKIGLPPRGLKNLSKITSSVKVPVIAIGGITPINLSTVLQEGASGIAVLSGILLAEDCTIATLKYREKLDEKR
ncbi:thiazole tautomerase TenI [Pseudogracilibacillus sp. SO30301A]|uniref:thiazole tautomerase TenI n=1 Tax=Pseudogracilibacillus sp. SO30301A TaxID=3098291 RepID=UPI00300E006C